METFYKDPDALLDYSIDWSDWLESGELLSSSKWIVSSGTLVVEDSSNSSTAATIWVKSGIVGESYMLTNRIETTKHRKEDRSFILKVEER